MKRNQELRQKGLRALHLGEDVLVALKFIGFGRAVILVNPEVIRRPRLRRELGAIEACLQLIDRALAPGELRRGARLREIVDLVVVLLLAKKRALNRREVQLFLEFRVEPGVQPGALRGDLLRARRLRRLDGGGWRWRGRLSFLPQAATETVASRMSVR